MTSKVAEPGNNGRGFEKKKINVVRENILSNSYSVCHSSPYGANGIRLVCTTLNKN